MRRVVARAAALAAWGAGAAACRPKGGGAGADDTGGADAPAETWLVQSLTFADRAADGTTEGFDLDGTVSAAGDPAGCGHADATAADGTAGIDSAFTGIWAALENTEAGAVEGLVAQSIANGELLLLFTVEGAPAGGGDGPARVVVQRGAGVPLLGTDGRLLDGQTIASDGAAPVVIEGGTVRGGVVEARPFAMDLPLQVLDVAVSFGMVDGALRIVPGPEGRATGHFAGAVPTADILRIVQEEQDLGDIRPLVEGLVAAAADLQPQGDGTCAALSITFAFEAVPAFVAAAAP